MGGGSAHVHANPRRPTRSMRSPTRLGQHGVEVDPRRRVPRSHKRLPALEPGVVQHRSRSTSSTTPMALDDAEPARSDLSTTVDVEPHDVGGRPRSAAPTPDLPGSAPDSAPRSRPTSAGRGSSASSSVAPARLLRRRRGRPRQRRRCRSAARSSALGKDERSGPPICVAGQAYRARGSSCASTRTGNGLWVALQHRRPAHHCSATLLAEAVDAGRRSRPGDRRRRHQRRLGERGLGPDDIDLPGRQDELIAGVAAACLAPSWSSTPARRWRCRGSTTSPRCSWPGSPDRRWAMRWPTCCSATSNRRAGCRSRSR